MIKIKNEAFKDCKVSCTKENIVLDNIEDFEGRIYIISRKFESPLKTDIARIVLISQFEKGYFDLIEWKLLTQSIYYLLNINNKEKFEF